ncbi:WxL domain-containing protein [Weissella cibaria]|uniref:WxL domain-containing protein n=1 Tax=Weissella cibaria TaxID=137591 RepID=UPI0021BE1714|nr:WxL domain-containing protein [Weissella cibaria]MCT8399023.1 hypothetical protein [Weissella cibaria]
MRKGLIKIMLATLAVSLTGYAAPALAATVTVQDLQTATKIGEPAANYAGVDEMTNAFLPGGTSSGFTNGWAQLTNGGSNQYGSASFKYQIDMTSSFNFKGGFKTSSGGNSIFGQAGDALGMILAPYDPSQMGNGTPNKYLGIGKNGTTGFSNAIFRGIDFYYNSDMGDSNIGTSLGVNSKQYASFRHTDSAGKLQNIGSNDQAQNVSLSRGGDDVGFAWAPVSVSSDGRQVVGNITITGYGKTWTQTVTVARNMGFSVFGSTGNETSTMSVNMKTFSVKYGTVQATFNGVAAKTTVDASDFKAPVFNPAQKPAVVGNTVTVVQSDADVDAASKTTKFDPNFVYVAPKVAGYDFTGDNRKNYQQFTIANSDDDTNHFDLTYEKKNKVTIKYQYATQLGTYFDSVTKSGYDGDDYSVTSPDIVGYKPDIATVTGKLGDKDTVIVTYAPLVNKPLNPFDPDYAKPVNPLIPGTDTPVGKEQSGILTVDYASTLDFGKQKISGQATTYAASAQKFADDAHSTLIAPVYAQVSDLRAQAGGWTLQLATSALKNKTTGKPLQGASLSFENAKMATTPGKLTGNVVDKQTVAFGQSATIMTTNQANIPGTWLAVFGGQSDLGQTDGRDVDQAVKLAIPGGSAQQGDYTADLTWTVLDTVGNK